MSDIKARADEVVGVGGRNANDSGGATASKNCQPPCSKGALIMKSLSIFLTGGRRSSKSTSRLQAAKKRRRRQRMDDTKGKLYPKQLEMLKKKTKFTKEELEALCQIYKKLVSSFQQTSKTLTTGTSTSAIVKPSSMTEGIDRIIFRELLYSTFDIITEEILMERIFCTWDKEHEGVPLKFESWLIGLSVFLRGTLTEKAAFCFRIYDLNSDGFITKDEMFTLLRNSLIKQPQDEDPDDSVKDLVEIILKKFDIDKDGKVSFEDYSQTVKEEPLLIEAFGQCLPSEDAIISFFSTLNI